MAIGKSFQISITRAIKTNTKIKEKNKMIKINSKTLKYLKNSSGNFAWQFKKGQAKELKIRQDRERERGRWRESWKNSGKNSPIHPFRSSSSISASFSAQRFLANSRLIFFLFAHFVFCFAFCFWLLVSYHLFLLFSADLEHFSYSLCVYYFASSY